MPNNIAAAAWLIADSGSLLQLSREFHRFLQIYQEQMIFSLKSVSPPTAVVITCYDFLYFHV